jgi:transposase
MSVRKKYSLEFKQMVIEEYLRTGCTQKLLLLKYDIRFVGSIDKWMRESGESRPRTGGGRRRINFEKNTSLLLTPDKPNKSLEELQAQILELKRQLEDEQLRSEALTRILEKAEKELNIPIRKKPNTK